MFSKIIFNGPTNRPMLYDTHFAVQTFENEKKSKELEKIYDRLKLKYKINIIEPWGSDRYFKMERNLWIYFITEPKKVSECIKQVQQRAAQKGTTSFKALNINLQKT
jgi:hypothetical protein